MNPRKKVALVTGGAVRIGRAICEELGAAGCHVVVHCNRSLKAAEQLRQRLIRLGVKAWVVRQPLEDEAGCRKLIELAWARAGRVDILINNAAVFHKNALQSVGETELQTEFGINLFWPVLLTRFFAEHAKEGSVVNLLDRRIMANDPECLAYSLSKKALAAFTAEAALALAPRITVNGVAPGAVLPPPGKGTSYLHDRAGRVPLGMRLAPCDIASAVLALVSLRGVTGQTVFVDGGQHLLGNGV